jgi:ADP-heptose:LPS heptosyltransferase
MSCQVNAGSTPYGEPCRADHEVLVHLASGIGNIALATPLLRALNRSGYTIDVLIDGDYADTAELLQGWSALRTVVSGGLGHRLTAPYAKVLPAVPPFYWPRYMRLYAARANCVRRPPDGLFYEDEQGYYLEFAKALGCEIENPCYYFLPIPPDQDHGVTSATLVLAPGCKTGEMASKRWPYFPELSESFEDVVVVGTEDDLRRFDGRPMQFPRHVRNWAGKLSLRETARVLAAAGAVVANDSGLGHVAGAVGTPTVMLFGPTPDRALGQFPPNVRVLRTGLPCEPC